MNVAIAILVAITILNSFCFATKTKDISKLGETFPRGDELITPAYIVPYLGGRQSPGDSIGMTWYEHQKSSIGMRFMIRYRL
jgi:hypothetical protein